jgi:hypothetical protein
MSKLGKVIVLRVPEGLDPQLVLGIVQGQLTKPWGHESCPEWCWRMGHFGARLVDLDAMEKIMQSPISGADDGYEPEPLDDAQYYHGYNAALRDVAGKGG